jgi:anti-sigma factor RsiW
VSTSRTPLPDDDLHAWVDARLAGERQARVEDAMRDDPSLQARANHYRAQNEALRALLAGELDEPVPARLVQAASRAPAPTEATPGARRGAAGPLLAAPGKAANHGRFSQVASLALALAVGVAAGWVARDAGSPSAQVGGIAAPGAIASGATLTRAAAVAHAAFAPEVRHPVEVGAGEQAHLVAWLSKRLGAPLKVPDLGAEGFRLMGGRLLPDEDGGVAAQFMFESAGGQRLTLFVRRDAAAADTAFRYAAQGSLGTFYWLDRGFGYALSGELPREAMLSVATSVYRQLNP